MAMGRNTGVRLSPPSPSPSPSPSRLSPLAKPFTFNRSISQFPCASALDSSFTVGSSFEAYGDYAQTSPFPEEFQDTDEDSFCWSNQPLLKQEQLDAFRVTPLKLSKSRDISSSVIHPNIPQCQLSICEPAVFSENVDSGGNHAVKKNEISSVYGPSRIKEPHFPLGANGKEISPNSDFVNSEQGRKYGEHVFDKGTSSSYMEKSELKISHTNFSDDFTSNSHGHEASVSIENPSIEDLDSPCWKGKLASCKSPFDVSRPVGSLLQNEKESSTSLNPLACQFFPSYVKGKIHESNEYVGNDSSSLHKDASSALNLLYGEHKFIDSVKSGSCTSEVGNSAGIRHFGCNYGGKQENGLPNNSKSRSFLNIHHLVQPRLSEHHKTSNEKLVIGENFTGFIYDMNDAADSASATIYFPAEGHVSSLSTSEVGSHNDTSGTLKGISDSFTSSSVIDVQIVIKAMHSLSELLVQNCSKKFDSFNESERDIIQCIINNLHMCIGKKNGQRLWYESTQPSTSYCPRLKEVLR